MSDLRKPNFFIIGAPKCGTTSMYYWLSQHSKIYFPERKELHYFGTDLNNKKRAIKNEEEYFNLFKDATAKHKILSEASVFYLYSKNAVDNILEFNKDAKFLVMLRNPVDMVLSLHCQYVYTGNEIYYDFEKAWRLQHERVKGVGITKIAEDPQLLQYGKVCSLGCQVQRLLSKVDENRVLFVTLDELRKDPENEVRKVFKFLEIEYQKIDYRIYNESTKRRSLRLHRTIKYLNDIKKSLGVGKLNTGFGQWLSRVNTTKGKKAIISNELRNKLRDYFNDDILLLEKLVNKDLQDWLK